MAGVGLPNGMSRCGARSAWRASTHSIRPVSAARLVGIVVAALALGMVVGTALAPLPYASNDECSRYDNAYVAKGAEGTQVDASLELWPLRMRCDYAVGAETTRSRVIGPGVAETVGWSALVALLMAGVLCRRRSVPLRGAVLAACFLAPVAVGMLWSEFVFAMWIAMWIGAPIVLALDLALRPAGERRWWRSVLLSGGLSAIVSFVCVVAYLAGFGHVGIAAGIAAGALAAVLLPRIWPPATSAAAQAS